MLSEQDVLIEIRQIVERELEMARDVNPTDRLVQDLGLDSMTLITLAVALEDRFQILLSDEEATRIETVGELARCIVARVAASRAELEVAS
jgi:acyl carrier protein